jgi:hypothetical protein
MGKIIDVNRRKPRDLAFTCGFCNYKGNNRTCKRCGTTNANAPLKKRGSGKFGRTAQKKVKDAIR